MKTSVMMMILIALTADSSGVCAPAPCYGQTFYRRIERHVNVRLAFSNPRGLSFSSKNTQKVSCGFPPSRGRAKYGRTHFI